MSNVAKALGDLTPEQRALLEQRLKAKMAARVEQIPKREDLTTFPLSFSQHQMWLFDQMSPDNNAYNIALAVRLAGHLNRVAWEQSLAEILRRHEALRANFSTEHGNPVQTILPAERFQMDYADLRELPKSEQENELRQIVADIITTPFNLAQDVLVRTALIQVADEDQIFAITMHHIVFDGWSLGVFMGELVKLYKAYTQNQPSPLAEPPIQYADYAVWQRGVLSGDALEQRLSYWRDQLKGPVPALELPTDRPRPANQTFVGSTQFFKLSLNTLERLKDLSRQADATLFMTLLATFYVLLYRYTGQNDLLVGSPVANRTRPELENLIGYFVNTLVVRTQVDGDQSFRSLLAKVRDVTLGAYAHQDVPFELLLRELKPERDLSRSPFFQAMFVLQNAPIGAITLPDLALEPYAMEGQASKYDLTLTVGESGNGMDGILEYNTDLFNADTMQQFVDHFQTLIEGIVANPDSHVADYPFLTAAERQQIVVDWNQTAADYSKDTCFAQLFEAQAAQTPDAIAVRSEDQRLTYRELNAKANQIAQHLRAKGIQADTLVGVAVERSLDMLVALLAVLKSGGAYVPMDPSFPAERLANIIEDAQMNIVLTQQHLTAALPQTSAAMVSIDQQDFSAYSTDNLTPVAQAENLAYVIFTSGSTGRPKGVQLTQRNLVNFLHSMKHKPGLKASDVLASVTTISFDIAGLELYLPLITGACVVIVGKSAVSDGKALAALLDHTGATVLQATPTTWRLLLDAGWMGKAGMKMLCGGEALPANLKDQLLATGGELWNMYGPTETTIWSTTHHILPSDEVISIGRPIANTQVYILDAHQQPVPVGVTGTLYIAGDGVARGYLKRPDLTAERFVVNPFSDSANARMYNTGDLARYLPDGQIECLGRGDNQVKVRGYRIELGEIEAVLSQYPGVKSCVVTTYAPTPDNKTLAAYLTTTQPDTAASDIRAYLRQTLPDYMIPATFTIMEALPLTPNGKIDRRALPAPEAAKPAPAAYFAAPTTPLETLVAGIWSQVLSMEQVSLYDNFFDLGGHSLMAVQVMAQIEEQTGRKLDPALLRFATVGQLAATLAEPEPVAAAPTKPAEAPASEGRLMGRLRGVFRSNKDNKS